MTHGAPLCTVIERYRPFIAENFDGDAEAFTHDCVRQCCRCGEYFAHDPLIGLDAGGFDGPDGWECEDDAYAWPTAETISDQRNDEAWEPQEVRASLVQGRAA
jgi:hypothetical protein